MKNKRIQTRLNYNNLDEFQQTWSWQPFCVITVKNSGGNSFVERSKIFHPQNIISLSIWLIIKPHTGFGKKLTPKEKVRLQF